MVLGALGKRLTGPYRKPKMKIDLKDCRIDTYRQAIRGAPTTMRLTHIPTGVVAEATNASAYLARKECLKKLEEPVTSALSRRNPLTQS